MNVDHPEIEYGKTGALIINLGTPDSTSWFDIRKYLKEFLSDKNSFKYFLMSNHFVESGVPKLTIKTPVLPNLILGWSFII